MLYPGFLSEHSQSPFLPHESPILVHIDIPTLSNFLLTLHLKKETINKEQEMQLPYLYEYYIAN